MAFLEEYTLLDELGQGGYATVYKVRHNRLGYIRAIRVLNAIIAHGESDRTYAKFLEECRLLLRLGNGNHPNIVHIYQPLLRAQRAIVEMDFVDGKNLYDYLKERSAFVPVEDVLKLLTDIGSALAYCHEDIYRFCMDKEEDDLQDDPEDGSRVLLDEETRRRLIRKYRVIHNDIHSGNIIRRGDGNYVLLDFGLAVEGDSVVRSSRRKNGAPEFKAPEKWDNEGILTTQSDIYSFGVVLYEFLAGRVPFPFDKKNSNTVEAEYLLGKAHKEKDPEPIFGLRKAAFEQARPGETYEQDYPDWLEEVIRKCLEKEAENRFRNGKELFECVQAHLASTTDGGRLKKLERQNQELVRQSRDAERQAKGLEIQLEALQKRLERIPVLEEELQREKARKAAAPVSAAAGRKPGDLAAERSMKTMAGVFSVLAIVFAGLFLYVRLVQLPSDYVPKHQAAEYRSEVDSLRMVIGRLNRQVENAGEASALEKTVNSLRRQLKDKDREISGLKQQVTEKDKLIGILNEQIGVN